jgi:hypothetical protein
MRSKSLSSFRTSPSSHANRKEILQARHRAGSGPVAQSGQGDAVTIGSEPQELRHVAFRQSLRRLHRYGRD